MTGIKEKTPKKNAFGMVYLQCNRTDLLYPRAGMEGGQTSFLKTHILHYKYAKIGVKRNFKSFKVSRKKKS